MASRSVCTVCSVCLRCFTVTSAGLVRIHGPISRRCPGSNQPHITTQSSSSSSSSVTDSQQSSSLVPTTTPTANGEPPIHFDFRHVKILKRIPKGSREPCLSKLTNILEGVVNNDSLERLIHFSSRSLRVLVDVGLWLQW